MTAKEPQMEFVIKVPGVAPIHATHASTQDAYDWAAKAYPLAHPASVICVSRLRGAQQ